MSPKMPKVFFHRPRYRQHVSSRTRRHQLVQVGEGDGVVRCRGYEGDGVVRWRGGVMARWCSGAVARWCDGEMVRWRGGVVARWCSGEVV